MAHVTAEQSQQSPWPSPTSSLTFCDNHSDPMDFEPYMSPAKDSAAKARFIPYPKHPKLQPSHQHPHAILAGSRGPCTDRSNKVLGPSEALQIFLRGIAVLPNHVLRSAVYEKFAMAETNRYQLLLATWDLEWTKRRVRTLEEIKHHLEAAHALNESEYNFWHQMYTDRGLPDLKEDDLYYGDQLSATARAADRDVTELSVMVEQARNRALNITSPSDTEHGVDIDEEGSIFRKDVEPVQEAIDGE
ncbi:hypothetical protein EV363DRAFT_1462264 [Boletus edulis]|nr:hypothetical protein EV363DRAFT_1462264 [Boletus edulis]